MPSTTDASEFWSAHLAAIEQRGVSIAEYAREHDLSAQSLYGWRSRCRQVSVTEQRVRFAEVVTTRAISRVSVRLRVGDMTLEFEQLPSASWLAELLATMNIDR